MKTKELKAFRPAPGAKERGARDELEQAQHERRTLEIEVTKLKERIAELERRLDGSERERERLASTLISLTTNPHGQKSAFDVRHVAELVEFLKKKR
jgi:predicted  nucleic acid-binding Zn-ribbon protein